MSSQTTGISKGAIHWLEDKMSRVEGMMKRCEVYISGIRQVIASSRSLFSACYCHTLLSPILVLPLPLPR